MQRLILASASEWRANLLRQAGFDVVIIPIDLDESPFMNSIANPETLVKTLAEKKMSTFQQIHSQSSIPVITADTVIFHNRQIIGKPTDRNHAKQIIQSLSGSTHDVWTGICIYPQNIIFAEKSSVTVKHMTDTEIESYLDTNEWVGKAGGYQLQKTLGNYICKIEGSYTNIIGLPISTLKNHFRGLTI